MAKEDVSRRDLMKLAVASSVGGATACEDPSLSRGEAVAVESEAVVVLAQTLVPMNLPNVHAYAQKSTVAGAAVDFRVSSTVSTQLSLVRLGWDTDSPSRDWIVAQPPAPAVQQQPIYPGSYIQVDNALSSTQAFDAFTLECWVRPWRQKWQGLLGQYTYPTNCGFGLFLDDSGRPAAYFGNGSAFNQSWYLTSGSVLPLRQWTHLVATFSGGTIVIYVNGAQAGAMSSGPGVMAPGSAPLRIGAFGQNGQTTFTLDGDLAMPVIYSTALAAATVATRANTKPPVVPTASVLACWPLDEEAGVNVRDTLSVRPGVVVNRGTWMIGGPGYNADGPFLPAYVPANDASRGHGLRLCSDDLYDCDWSISRSATVPADLPPGIFTGRLNYVDNSQTARRYDATFVVRRAAGKPQAPILVLCNTNTWLAYSAPFYNIPDATNGQTHGGPSVSVPGSPSYNMYNDHAGPQPPPAYQVGSNMPWSAFPYLTYVGSDSHLVRAERFLHVWLEQNGYDYDLATDLELHQNAAVLNGYKVVVINGHSEYWSAQSYLAIKSYLAGGGRLLVTAGNTMFWRVSHDLASGVMECRKCASSLSIDPNLIGGRPYAKPGELYFSSDGSRGGLLRESGYPAFPQEVGDNGLPAWRLIGLETVGYGSNVGSYVVRAATHPAFVAPENLGVTDGNSFGVGTVHHEYDVRPSTSLGAPNQPQSGLTLLADSQLQPGTRFNYQGSAYSPPQNISSEVVFWDRPAGGKVFNAGAIGVSSKLATDAKLGGLIRNVLHQFGVTQRLNLFVVDGQNRVRLRYYDGATWGPSGGAWDNSLGGAITGPVEVVRQAPNQISVMGINAAGDLLYRYWSPQGWQPVAAYQTHAGPIVGRPAAVGFGRNKINIYARGSDLRIRMKSWDGASWIPGVSSWIVVDAQQMGTDPAAVAWQGQRISLAAVGMDGHVWYKEWDGTAWTPTTGWADFGSGFQFAPALVAWGGNRLALFAVRSDAQLQVKLFNGTTWDSNWTNLGGALSGRPVAVARRLNEISVFARQGGTIQCRSYDGSTWPGAWIDLGVVPGMAFVDQPAATTWRDNHMSVTGVTSTGAVMHKWTNGTTWFPSSSGWDNVTGNVSGARTPTALHWIVY